MHEGRQVGRLDQVSGCREHESLNDAAEQADIAWPAEGLKAPDGGTQI